MNLNPDDILKDISLLGVSDKKDAPINIFINKNIGMVCDRSSGRLRIRPAKKNLFKVVFNQVPELSSLSPLEIRCLNCGKIISYPARMAKIELAVNVMYYFLCFDSLDSIKCIGR